MLVFTAIFGAASPSPCLIAKYGGLVLLGINHLRGLRGGCAVWHFLHVVVIVTAAFQISTNFAREMVRGREACLGSS